MYVYVHNHWRKSTYICTCVNTRCNALLAYILSFYKNNVGRFYLLHTPIWVDVTACFRPISCMCSICVCQVAFELYRIMNLKNLNLCRYICICIYVCQHGHVRIHTQSSYMNVHMYSYLNFFSVTCHFWQLQDKTVLLLHHKLWYVHACISTYVPM